MEKLFSSFIFTRILLATILANLGAFVVLYVGQLDVSSTGAIYLSLFLGGLYLANTVRFRLTRIRADIPSLAMLAITLLLLTLPRLTYLLDWLPGNTTLSFSDDYARMLEILAMTANDSYPLLSPSNTDYLFSYYYAGLFPMAIIKLAVPALTIKESIALGNFYYHSLILLSLYEISHLVLRSYPQKVRMLIFLFTLFGGLDWIAKGDFSVLYGHYEWWQKRFSGNTQLSSFYTGMFWTVHHFLAAYTAILAYCIAYLSSASGRKQTRDIIVLLLLISIFYTSPFVFLSLIPFLLIHWKKIFDILRQKPSWLIIIASIPPIAIFLNRVAESPYIWSTFRLDITDHFLLDKMLSLPLYLVLVPVVELAGIPLVLAAITGRLNKLERKHLLAAWAFFILTYFLAYAHGNNFAMRGMLLPTAVFFFLFAAHWPELRDMIGRRYTPALILLAVLFTAGTLMESAGRLKIGIERSNLLGNTFGIIPHNKTIQQALRLPVYATATQKDLTVIPYEDLEYAIRRNRYDYEKFIDHIRLDKMFGYEKDLIRKPFSWETGPSQTGSNE